MTKKDYELISSEIKRLLEYNQDDNGIYNVLVALSENLADKFQKNNPRFNSDVFLEACGV